MGNYASDQKNTRRFAMKLSKSKDNDIIEFLDSLDNVQGYLRELIRKDIKNRGE